MFHHIVSFTMHHSPALQQLGFTLIRVAFGTIFLISGYNKLMSGSEHLTQLGSAMGLFGITWGYCMWGYAAALTELCGGISFMLGFGTRIASLPLIWLLIVAIKFHLQKNDPFMKWSFAAMCLCIVISYLLAGSGMYSVDHMLQTCSSCHTSPHNHHR
jgi:putative oxidoreductase